MMKIEVLCSTTCSLEGALIELQQQLNHCQPSLLMVYCSDQHDPAQLSELVKCHFGKAKFIGCTSCRGLMSHQGHQRSDDGAIGIMALTDPDGAYGVGYCDIQRDAKEAGTRALMAALENSGRAGELPGYILLHTSPGYEEAVLEGIAEIMGNSIPVIGGSAADNHIAGNWSVFNNYGVGHTSVSLAVCYPSCAVALAFNSGYDPQSCSGLISKANGRELLSIDGKPAADVYKQWTNGLEGNIYPNSKILAQSSLSPLGRKIDKTSGFPFYKLSHPELITDNNGIRLFTEVHEGERIHLMQGSKKSLISRAGRVVQAALDDSNKCSDELAGAFVVYCAGCMMTVNDEMNEVINSINQSSNGIPFLGAYTFGEQGQMPDNSNAHGNLMISALLFFKDA